MTTTTIEVKPATNNKNADGHLGAICNNCGGFGYTLGIPGETGGGGCHDCNQTGVAAMTNAQLQEIVTNLAQQLTDLKNLIITELGAKK